eukprot:gene21447-biopygen7369
MASVLWVAFLDGWWVSSEKNTSREPIATRWRAKARRRTDDGSAAITEHMRQGIADAMRGPGCTVRVDELTETDNVQISQLSRAESTRAHPMQ